MTRYYNTIVTEGTVTEPVSLQEVKDWLQIDFDDKDSLITSMITGARQSLEKYLNLHLVPKDVTLDVQSTGEIVILPYAYSPGTIEINQLDSADQTNTLTDGQDYYSRGNTLRIGAGRYVISYATTPAVPEALKEAIKMEVAERFQNRGEYSKESSIVGLSQSAIAKAQPYQMTWI
jgi:hypothetical protein